MAFADRWARRTVVNLPEGSRTTPRIEDHFLGAARSGRG